MSQQTTSIPRKRWYPVMRQLHLWIGAWGALAAILFGITGLLLNHRAVWQLPQGERLPLSEERITVPLPARANSDALSAWLAASRGLRTNRIRIADPVAASDGGAVKPEVWTLAGGTARESWTADFAVGDASLLLKRNRSSALATLLSLHKSQSGNIGWILLADSFALAMAALGISGIAMWSRGRSLRQWVMSLLGLSALVAAILFGLGRA